MTFLCKHEKYENLIFIKIIPISRHMYVLSKIKGIHTNPKHNWVHKEILHETQMTQGYTWIPKVLTKINIYMKIDILK